MFIEKFVGDLGRTPIRAGGVGEDPVEFAEIFFRNYSDGQWINKEPERLVKAIERADAEDGGTRS